MLDNDTASASDFPSPNYQDSSLESGESGETCPPALTWNQFKLIPNYGMVGPRILQVLNHAAGPGEDEMPSIAPAAPQGEKEDAAR